MKTPDDAEDTCYDREIILSKIRDKTFVPTILIEGTPGYLAACAERARLEKAYREYDDSIAFYLNSESHNYHFPLSPGQSENDPTYRRALAKAVLPSTVHPKTEKDIRDAWMKLYSGELPPKQFAEDIRTVRSESFFGRIKNFFHDKLIPKFRKPPPGT